MGALKTTPAANMLKETTTHCARRAVFSEQRRKTVPRASHGTFTTAPSRKNTRKVPWSQPVDVPVASAGRREGEQRQGDRPRPVFRTLGTRVPHEHGLREQRRHRRSHERQRHNQNYGSLKAPPHLRPTRGFKLRLSIAVRSRGVQGTLRKLCTKSVP